MGRKSSKAGRRRTRKLKGGYYSFSGAVGTGAPNWTRGSEVPTPDYVSKGGRRRSRKGGNIPKPPGPPVKPNNTRPSKSSDDEPRKAYGPMKVRRMGARRTRKLKGGGMFGATSASYQGTGARGVADFVAVDTKGPYVNGGAKGGAFNDYGAKPGSSF
jgi:hypothetical protein